jgi:hypothetical protein
MNRGQDEGFLDRLDSVFVGQELGIVDGDVLSVKGAHAVGNRRRGNDQIQALLFETSFAFSGGILSNDGSSPEMISIVRLIRMFFFLASTDFLIILKDEISEGSIPAS